MLESIASGFAAALTPQNLLFCLIGVSIGTAVGMLPGLGSATGVALLFPIVAGLNDPLAGLIMLAGLYYGAQYGSTISSVLLATPGETSSIVTVYDGYPLARRGRAGVVLSIAAVSSFVAGVISTGLLMAVAPALSRIALEFGPPEMFALLVLGMLSIAGLTGGSMVKGLAMAMLGLAISTVGIDAQSGVPRFTFDQLELYGGFGLIEVLIGVFAIGEVIRQTSGSLPRSITTRLRDMWPRWSDLRRTTGPVLRGTVLGFGLGTLPGIGSTLASFASYGMERRISRTPERFGTGMVEGVSGPEASNNAAVNGAFVPTLTLGIPGSGTTAVLLGAFVVLGLQPGPLLMEQQPTLVWGLLASFLIGNLLLLVLNLPLAPVFASILRLRYAYLYPVIIFVALLGAYSVENRMWGVWIALAFGLLGYFMARYSYPAAPFVLGLILGIPIEGELDRTLSMGHGSLAIFLNRPIALALFGAAAVSFAGRPLYRALRRRRRGARAPEGRTDLAIDRTDQEAQ